MKAFLAIDPGIDTGWALFMPSKALVRCGLGAPPTTPVLSVVIEKPQVYRARESKGDPNNLITLAIQVGRYVERFEVLGAKVTLHLPNEWKGQLPKGVMSGRTLKGLSLAEQAVVNHCLQPIAPSKRHNVMDAVALGVWAFKMGVWS